MERLYAAVDEFWDGDVPGLPGTEDLEPERIIIQFGLPPNRIDLIKAMRRAEADTPTSVRRPYRPTTSRIRLTATSTLPSINRLPSSAEATAAISSAS